MRLLTYRRALVCVLAAALAACGGESGPDEPKPAVPGTLTLLLATPNKDDDAIRLTITSGVVRNVTAAPGLTLLHRETPTQTVIILAGGLSSGVIARIDVPDVNRAATYGVTLNEIADAGHAIRASTSGYQLVLETPKAP